ncbi:hypothetical protein [Actinacidiphila oryziradicis]|uniref:DUF2690 domain-containing protein n=1 Tax=Actinacidiphila oryziradicis TaxID=2571141 RepID=A0A4U0SF32_9ACTN|nr:hypothetical protein [Actinacidiphila oryziradicis]TKA06351.1 hypothetical protein FCI23_32440 [Actinacidiphila oryziradicis]
MRPSYRALVAFTSSMALGLLGVGVTAAPASAAGCYGYTCHGYDMYHFGCTYTSTTSAAAVDKRTGVIVGYVYNRYSKGCNSNWAEAQLTPAGVAAGDTLIAQIVTTDSKGNSEVMNAPAVGNGNQGALTEAAGQDYSGSASIYTDMVDGTNLTYSYALVTSPSAGGMLVSYGTGEATQ